MYGVCPSSLEELHYLTAKGYLLLMIFLDGSYLHLPLVSFLYSSRINLQYISNLKKLFQYILTKEKVFLFIIYPYIL